MMIRIFCWKKAVPAIMAGVAFFLTGCLQSIPVERNIERVSLTDQFSLAERYWMEGDYNNALKAYDKYLEKGPEGEKAAFALHHMAEIYLKTGQNEKAVSLFEKIQKEHLYYPELPLVIYQTAREYYLMGDYRRSKGESLIWIEKYPRHSLKGDILLLLGDSCRALGDNLPALRWWLKAKKEHPCDFKLQAKFNERAEALIENCSVQELEQLAPYASETALAPMIYYRMAIIFLEQDELEKAKEAAMSLIRASPEQHWVLAGRRLLDIIGDDSFSGKVVLGCLLPLSGPFAIYGEEVLNGIQLGMGMPGEPADGVELELIIKDTEGKEKTTLTALEEMVKDDKVVAVIGPLSSRIVMAAAGKAQELGIPLITFTQKQGVCEKGDMIFRNFLTPSREVKRLVDTAIEDMGLKRFGILYPDDPYGHVLMNLFWDRLDEMGGTVTAVESYDPDQTDFVNQIKKIAGLYYPRPEYLREKLGNMWPPEQEESEIYPEEPEPVIDFDAVFIPDNFQSVAMIAPQLAYYDVLNISLLGTSLWQSPQLIEMAGDYIQDAIFTSGFFDKSEDVTVKAFVENYKDNFESVPGVLAATGYDTIRLLKYVAQDKNLLTGKVIQKALFQCPGFAGITGMLSFDSSGEVRKEPFLLTVAGKRMALFSPDSRESGNDNQPRPALFPQNRKLLNNIYN